MLRYWTYLKYNDVKERLHSHSKRKFLFQKFFHPAIVNIKNNLGKDSISEEHVKEVCRNMLEDAKCMYEGNTSRDSSPYECSDSETSTLEGRTERNVNISVMFSNPKIFYLT